MANMNSLFAKPGPTTRPTQPTVQPAASTLTGTGTPWQRGTRGMDRVTMPGVKSYAPQKPVTPPAAPFGGVQSLSRPPASGMNPQSPFAPGGRMDPMKPQVPPQQPAGFGGVAPTGDTSTWTPADWQRYNQFQQQNPLAAALSNYGG